MAAPSLTLFPSNEMERTQTILQLSARPVGQVPPFILQQETPPPFALLAQEVKPLEKSAVLYSTSSHVDLLFIQLIRQEKTSLTKEERGKIIETKQKLLKLAHQYQYIDQQLNIFKILNLRLMAKISQLLRKIPPNVQKMVGSSSIDTLTTLKLSFAQFKIFLHDLEMTALENQEEISWPKREEDDLSKLFDHILTHLSDQSLKRDIKALIKGIQEDKALLENLLLAPRTLVPLAIASLGNTSRELLLGTKEMQTMLEENYLLLEVFLEEFCINNRKQVEQKGTQGKKCQAALRQFYEEFKQNYRPLCKSAFRFLQQMHQQVYGKPSSCAADHLRHCQQILAEYKKLNLADTQNELEKKYYNLLAILAKAPQLPLFAGASSIIINYHFLPFQAAFGRFYNSSIVRSIKHLEDFCRAHERYAQLIPLEQRQMQTDIYTPSDLICINFLELIELIVDQLSDIALNTFFHDLGKLILMINTHAKQWYGLSFPYFSDTKGHLAEQLKEGQCLLNKAEAALHPHPVLLAKVAPSIRRIKELFECLKLFLKSPSAYPFLFSPLGRTLLQENSHEHDLTARLACQVYHDIKMTKEEAFTITLPPDEDFPQTLAEEGMTRSDFEEMFPPTPASMGTPTLIPVESKDLKRIFSPLSSHMHKMCVQLHLAWQDLPPITSSNLLEIYPQFTPLLSIFITARRDLSILKLEESYSSDEEKQMIDEQLSSFDVSFFFLYQIIDRYVVLRTQANETLSPFKSLAFTSKRQIKQPHLSTKESPSEKNQRKEQNKSPIQALHSSLHLIQHALALPTKALQAESLKTMRDYHYQIAYHLSSIKDLLSCGTVKSLSYHQLKGLLTHQAYALEQAVKLAALARSPTGKQEQELKNLLKSSHQPSAFFSSFLPLREGMDRSRWENASFIASAIDGFLTVPARYGVGVHPWMSLLKDAANNEQSSFQRMDLLIQDNLMALQVLFEDTLNSLPQPNSSITIPSLQAGLIDGLNEQGLLQSPQPPLVQTFPIDSILTSLNSLSHMSRVSRVSPYETTTDLIRREDEIHSNLYILQANIEEIDELLQEANAAMWCSTYSSLLLLPAAAILEKSLQSLLFWLPVASEQDEDRHYLFSTRPGPNHRPVPLRHTHSIVENGKVIVQELTERNETHFAKRLQEICDQFGWLEPFIQQLYRYPFSPTEHRSANIPRLFHSLAALRRDVHEGSLSVSAQNNLKEALITTSTDLVTAYDQLIEAHLQARVIAPVHEILAASQSILSMLDMLIHR